MKPSTAAPPPTALLWRLLRIYQLFGANTDVGKTVFATMLARAARRNGPDDGVAYLKPVSTGPAAEADDRHVRRFAPGVTHQTLFQYERAASPHAAARSSGKAAPDDETLLDRCRAAAAECAGQGRAGWLWVETAGGVLSPGPSGTPQAQLYAPLRLPAVLVGDARLGGISATLAAWETLRLRGYAVEAVLLFRGGGGGDDNAAYLAGALGDHGPAVVSVAAPPARGGDAARDAEAMAGYYARDDCARAAGAALAHLGRRHQARVAELDSLAARARARLWYPFTQQDRLAAADIAVVDSAHGDLLQMLARDPEPGRPLLRASFDGSASWWTQGLGHGHPALTLAAASAAGRYGHVLLAGTAHAPAVAAAEALVAGAASPRLRRVFFSDNGSTGIEVAVKMGLRAARRRYRDPDGAGAPPPAVLGLRGGYHGDTHGAMACAAPGSFNRKAEWYEPGRGHWMASPSVLCVDGAWTVAAADPHLRAGLGPDRRLPSLGHVFDLDAREHRGEHRPYEAYVIEALRALRRQRRRLGALVLEPVVLGAGGMTLVDPLFQRTLVNVVRRQPQLVAAGADAEPPPHALDWSGLPVIFDEVFTGLYRLGRFTSASFLGLQPDISVHAKLLTGGLVPLCATLASEAIFDAFRGPDHTDALLHGHSYTAHPVGCQAAVAALGELQAMERRGAWDWAKTPARGWAEPAHVWSVWPLSLVERLSRRRPRVRGVWALGSVLAVHLDAGPAAGYGSDAAAGLRAALARDRAPWNAHVRVLGDVLYVMASQTTTEAAIDHLATLLDEALAS